VTDAGPVADPAPYVGAADAVVLSSRSEGTPIAILEARALGKPVVATAVGGVPELVGGRDGDETVAPGDAAALGAAFARVRPRPGIGPAPAATDETVAATAALYHRLLADGGAARTGHPPRGA
jgi:glycosyltransferase involved in cell wall biosynthesis